MLNIANKSKELGDGLICRWEEFWVIHQPYLLQTGYLLPERYNPKWIPSWYGTNKERRDCPDAHAMKSVYPLIDATRLSDGSKVVIKVVNVTEDVPILEYLNSPQLLSDKRNHTVPIYDKIPVPDDEERVWIVMPFLLDLDTFAFPFCFVSEVVECVSQFLEGLEFMHEHRIAHRDACFKNLMLDSSKLVPDGDISFFRPSRTADWKRFVESVERRSVAPLKYFFIDFETAIFSVDDVDSRCIGGIGQDRTVPELADRTRQVPYNPFKLDIYQLGRMLASFLSDYDGMEFLLPLHNAMTCQDPDKRPGAAEANALFKRMILSFTEADMSRRVWQKFLPLKYRQKIEFPKSQPKRGIRTLFLRMFRVTKA